ncbi:MAG: hypothetical protein ABS49_00395 [Erythrobacter sp. SCN 62-14]|nr:MAG: hypothetical protein ABS49_00395 [Erythrobacter sp. SCN 62-14]
MVALMSLLRPAGAWAQQRNSAARYFFSAKARPVAANNNVRAAPRYFQRADSVSIFARWYEAQLRWCGVHRRSYGCCAPWRAQ